MLHPVAAFSRKWEFWEGMVSSREQLEASVPQYSLAYLYSSLLSCLVSFPKAAEEMHICERKYGIPGIF